MRRRLDITVYIVSAIFLIGAASVWWQGVRPGGPITDKGLLSEKHHPLAPGNAVGPERDKSGGIKEPAEAASPKEPAVLVVHVGGAVKSSGIYRLREGQRVYEAVMLAEPEEDADLDFLNLAALLKDSQKIIVPRKGSAASPEKVPSVSGPRPVSEQRDPGGPSFPLNLNTASASDLEALPGIGPSIAGAIIDYRNKFGPFKKVEDLRNVSGIGVKILSRISALVVAE